MKTAEFLLQTLERNGIEVVRSFQRETGAAVLQAYAASGGAIYNAGTR